MGSGLMTSFRTTRGSLVAGVAAATVLLMSVPAGAASASSSSESASQRSTAAQEPGERSRKPLVVAHRGASGYRPGCR